MSNTLLQVEKLTKRFPTVLANDAVSFDVSRGEVHCLLGENGAGKSTLAECLYGTYQPTEGEIRFRGKVVKLKTPRDAIRCGIGMVHQHFVLAQPMTVLDNIVLGTDETGILLKTAAAEEKIRKLCAAYEIDMDLQSKIQDISVSKQQWVEILKALYVGVDLLILDEPTAVLTPQEIESLFATLRKMTEDGLSVILITHKFSEVLSVSDRITVLRKGKLIGTVNTKDIEAPELARMMVGRDVAFRVDKPDVQPGKAVLQLEHVSLKGSASRQKLDDVNLEIKCCEVLGVAGVGGNGQRSLFDVIVGVTRPDTGCIKLEGRDVTDLSVQNRMDQGIAGIPEDRIKQALPMDFPIKESMVLGRQSKPPFCKNGFMSRKAINEFAEKAIADYEIAVTSGDIRTATLSGGNLQKVILARELSMNPHFVIASQPTRGLDVGAIEYVHNRLLELRSEQVGIMLISEDLDEIFNLSDRIAVIYKGRIMGVYNVDEISREKVGLLMAGIEES